MNRGKPSNLSAEPPYPGAQHVVCFSIRFPDMTAHLPHPDCTAEPSGHPVSECGVYQKRSRCRKDERECSNCGTVIKMYLGVLAISGPLENLFVCTNCAPDLDAVYSYVWRLRCRLPDRTGTRCRVLVRSRRVKGSPANILIEFADGARYVVGWRSLRKAK